MSTTNVFDAYRMDDRVVVVTGAASGIGAETCAVLGAAGATVVCADIDTAVSGPPSPRSGRRAARAFAVPTDVTVRADVAAVVDRAVGEFGRLDGMCNIAGAMFPGLIEDLDDDMIDRGIALNLKGVLYGTQYAIRAMKGAGRGRSSTSRPPRSTSPTPASASTRSPRRRSRCSP